jgi:hypothetical protein
MDQVGQTPGRVAPGSGRPVQLLGRLARVYGGFGLSPGCHASTQGGEA